MVKGPDPAATGFIGQPHKPQTIAFAKSANSAPRLAPDNQPLCGARYTGIKPPGVAFNQSGGSCRLQVGGAAENKGPSLAAQKQQTYLSLSSGGHPNADGRWRAAEKNRLTVGGTPAFLALVRANWKPVIPAHPPGMTFQEYMKTLGKGVAVLERGAPGRGALSFMLCAWTHEEMRSRVIQFNAELYSSGAKRWRQSF